MFPVCFFTNLGQSSREPLGQAQNRAFLAEHMTNLGTTAPAHRGFPCQNGSLCPFPRFCRILVNCWAKSRPPLLEESKLFKMLDFLTCSECSTSSNVREILTCSECSTGSKCSNIQKENNIVGPPRRSARGSTSILNHFAHSEHFEPGPEKCSNCSRFSEFPKLSVGPLGSPAGGRRAF